MKAATAAFEAWGRKPMAERAELLFRAADAIRKRRFEFDAWLVFEVAKNWARWMRTSAKRSISSIFTRAKRYGWRKRSRRCNYPANATHCATSRSASAR